MEKQIDHLEKTFKFIKKNIDDIDDAEIIKDKLELSDSLYDFIKIKDDKWFQKFFAMLKSRIDYESMDDIIKPYKNNNRFIPDFITYLENELLFDANDDIIDNVDNLNNIDDIDDLDDIDDKDIKLIELRENQLDAINRTIDDGFSSGIHCQNMGAGKSIIFLNIIQKHYDEFQINGSLYIITCFRQEILKDLFFDNQNNLKNLDFWKKNKIINLNQFNVINCIDYKPKKIIIHEDKPNILIINTDYLKSLDNNNNIDHSLINLIILDECHAISADKFYDVMYKYKYNYKIPIIGLSATPLRDKADKKVIDIFCKNTNKNDKNKKLNLISSYDMFECIKDNITLPPHYTFMEINKMIGHKIGRTNKDVIKKILDKKMLCLPYKKIIGWTKTIATMKEFYKYFKEIYPDYKIYCSCSKDDSLNKYYNTNLDEFYKLDDKAFLICVNRCREGSDIKNLDCAIYLDAVKKRTTLVALQTSGRVLRPDVLSKKTRGYIIDTFISDPLVKVEVLTIEKIVGYYKKIFHLSNNTLENKEEELNNIIDMCEHIEIDEKNQQIKLKIDDNEKHDNIFKFQLTTKQIDWSIIKQELSKHIMKGLSEDEKFNLIIKRIKETGLFTKDCDFWKVYNDIKDKYNFPDNFKEEYKDKFKENTWFDLLDIEHNYYTSMKEIKKSLKHLKKINKMNYILEVKKNINLPPYPEYLINNFWTEINIHKNNDIYL
jgi:superfamily II DNA or RNA helicase